mmetsp:Transcript_34102/g.109901  ORF Transcript_34102/g.109901 Transcript_34102/m.109901 type:complete len:321 (-) Transcript_34102:105-1067(-)
MSSKHLPVERSDSHSRREENVGMEAVAAELKVAATEYRQAETAKDVLAEVVQPPALKQQFVAYGDRSAPVVEPDVTIKMSPMAELKEELTGPSPELRHVEASADRSAPVVEPGVKFKESPMGALQKEIEAKQADIKGFATTGAQRVAAKDVLAEVAKGSPRGLKHVDDAAGDRSAPVIAPDVTIKPSPMADLKKEITDAPPSLRPRSDSSDRSAPVVEAGVAVKPSPMAALQKEIGAKQEGIRSLAASGGVKVLKEGVLDDIAKGSGASLKSAGPTADRSAPLIAPDVEVTPRDLPTTWPEIQPEMGPRLDRDGPEVVLR